MAMDENETAANRHSPRWMYLDVCRLLAIFCVVLIHVTATQWHVDPVDSTDWVILTAYFGGTRFTIPMFFMMSGALLLQPDRKLSLKTLYGRYILRFVTALLFWSLLYHAVVVYAWNPYFNMDDFDAGLFVRQVLGGHPYQHWFLFAIIGMYLLVPLLKCITRSRTATAYFLVLWLLWEVGIFNLRLFFVLFPDMNPSLAGLLNGIIDAANKVPPRMVLGLHGYMVLGYYLHAYPPGVGSRRLLQAAGILGMVFTVAVTCVISARNGVRTETFLDLNTFPVCIAAAAAFVTARALFPAETDRENRVVAALAEHSFGIYLVHDFFLVYLRDKGFTPAILPRFLSPLVVTVVVYALSLIVVRLIRKIPVVRDYIT